MGETAPVGYDTVNVRTEGAKALTHDVAPLEFLRDALCLNTKYRKSPTCTSLPAYGYAHHAYTVGSPYYKPEQGDDVTLGVLGRLSSALAESRSIESGGGSRNGSAAVTHFGVVHLYGYGRPPRAL